MHEHLPKIIDYKANLKERNKNPKDQLYRMMNLYEKLPT
jgi:hypothetical protein